MGKAYANRKKEEDRPENDFYPTPGGLTIELINTGQLNDCETFLEPCCGNYAISNILKENGYNVTSKDIIYGNDFLADDYTDEKYDCVITNPPFDIYNKIVNKAKEVATKKVIVIGRTNYFASHDRNVNGFWEGLSDVYLFDRQVAYDRPLHEDGKFECGCLVTGWFVWTKGYEGDIKVHIVDVQKWAYHKPKKPNKNKKRLKQDVDVKSEV